MVILNKKSLTFNNVSSFLVCVLMMFAWLSPHHYFPWGAAYSNFASLLAFILLVAFYFKNHNGLRFPKNIWFIPFISVIPLIQIFIFPYMFFGDALVNIAYILSFSLIICIAYSVTYNDRNLKEKFLIGFCWLFIIGGLISFYIAMVQWLNLSHDVFIMELPGNNRPAANFNQPNTFAFFQIITLLCVFFLFEKKHIQTLVACALASVLLYGIAITQTRMAWLNMFVLSIFFMLKIFLNKEQFRINFFVPWLLFFLFVFFVWVIPEINNGILKNSYEIVSGIERATTSYSRIEMWKMLLQAVKMQPWLGYGWGQVSVAEITATPIVSHNEWVANSHNVILDILIWNGVPLGLVILFLCLKLLLVIIKNASSTHSIIGTAMVLAFSVYSLVEFPYNSLFLLLPIGFILGSVLGNLNKQIAFKVIKLPISFKLGFVISILVLYILLLREYLIIERDVRLLRFELNRIGQLHSKEKAPRVYLLNHLRQNTELLRTNPFVEMSDKQLDWMKHIAHKYPNPAALKRYAQALGYNGRKLEAEHQLFLIEKIYELDLELDILLNDRYSLTYEWENVTNEK